MNLGRTTPLCNTDTGEAWRDAGKIVKGGYRMCVMSVRKSLISTVWGGVFTHLIAVVLLCDFPISANANDLSVGRGSRDREGGAVTVHATTPGNAADGTLSTSNGVVWGTGWKNRSRAIFLDAGSTAIKSADGHTCAVLSSGIVDCWGHNRYGQLGRDTTPSDYAASPAPVDGVSGAIAVAGGLYHTCALLRVGTVQCWGDNRHGQLGHDTAPYDFSTVPVPVDTLENIVAITAGDKHTAALRSDGMVISWGGNYHGQLGNGSTEQSGPVEAIGVQATSLMSRYDQTFALLSDNTLMSWGDNQSSQLGYQTPTGQAFSTTPQAVEGIYDVLSVAVGDHHTCVVVVGGMIQCWGGNFEGQLGDGTQNNSTTPVFVKNISTAVAVSSGDLHTCALLSNDSLQCWGRNAEGQLGDGGLEKNAVEPVTVLGVSRIKTVVGGGLHTCALRMEGGVQCWGENATGQLGDGTTNSSPIAVSVILGTT